MLVEEVPPSPLKGVIERVRVRVSGLVGRGKSRAKAAESDEVDGSSAVKTNGNVIEKPGGQVDSNGSLRHRKAGG